jgi:chromatin segregation and condensation protein Rec8/ScpA/Scc1 (kleisin family)
LRAIAAPSRRAAPVISAVRPSSELYREGKVELQQAATFGEIEVEWRG